MTEFLNRFSEFCAALTCIPGTEEMEGLHEYDAAINLSIKLDKPTAANRHRAAVKAFLVDNKDVLYGAPLREDMKIRGQIKLMTGKACIDMSRIWELICQVEDRRVRSDFVQWLYGVLEKSDLLPGVDFEAKQREIIDVFGEGTPALEETSETTVAEDPIEKAFGGNTAEDKFIRNLMGQMKSKTVGKNPAAAMKQFMNPANLAQLLSLANGRKKGINIRRLIQRLAEVVPEDAEI